MSSRPIGTYMLPAPPPVFRGADFLGKGLTMVQFFSGKHIAEDEPRAAASSGQDEGVQEASEDGNGSDSEPPSTVFLEDLETYKAYLWVDLNELL